MKYAPLPRCKIKWNFQMSCLSMASTALVKTSPSLSGRRDNPTSISGSGGRNCDTCPLTIPCTMAVGNRVVTPRPALTAAWTAVRLPLSNTILLLFPTALSADWTSPRHRHGSENITRGRGSMLKSKFSPAAHNIGTCLLQRRGPSKNSASHKASWIRPPSSAGWVSAPSKDTTSSVVSGCKRPKSANTAGSAVPIKSSITPTLHRPDNLALGTPANASPDNARMRSAYGRNAAPAAVKDTPFAAL